MVVSNTPVAVCLEAFHVGCSAVFRIVSATDGFSFWWQRGHLAFDTGLAWIHPICLGVNSESSGITPLCPCITTPVPQVFLLPACSSWFLLRDSISLTAYAISLAKRGLEVSSTQVCLPTTIQLAVYFALLHNFFLLDEPFCFYELLFNKCWHSMRFLLYCFEHSTPPVLLWAAQWPTSIGFVPTLSDLLITHLTVCEPTFRSPLETLIFFIYLFTQPAPIKDQWGRYPLRWRFCESFSKLLTELARSSS